MRNYLWVLDWIEEFEDDPEPRWFPVFGFLNASVVINCGADPETRGTVALWWPHGGFDEGRYRPRSLAEPVEWWAGWIETAASYWTINEAGEPQVRSRLTRDQLTAEQLASDMHDA
jgi:hypothetical protein